MVIREMTKDDYETFCRLATAFYNSGASLANVSTENFKRTFNECMSNSPYIKGYLIESDGKPAGYILLTYTWYCEFSGETVTIDEIYIDDAFRGLGLGSQAIQWVFSTHQNYHGVQVEVKTDNKKAIDLYKRLGFDFIEYLQMVAKPNEEFKANDCKP